jgi:hypothetical protein
MPDVTLLVDIAKLPAVCVRCGRPAAGVRRVRLLPEGGNIPPGCLTSLSSPASRYQTDYLLWLLKGGPSIRLPVCSWHRWIVPPGVRAEARGESVRLLNIGDGFAAALRAWGWRTS